jgi:hypothetical protein
MTDHPPDSDDLTPTGKQELASDDSSQAYGADHRLYFLVNGRIITIGSLHEISICFKNTS